MNIKFLNIEWRARYSLTNFEDNFMPQLFFKLQYV